jgi:hypothetical protein
MREENELRLRIHGNNADPIASRLLRLSGLTSAAFEAAGRQRVDETNRTHSIPLSSAKALLSDTGRSWKIGFLILFGPIHSSTLSLWDLKAVCSLHGTKPLQTAFGQKPVTGSVKKQYPDFQRQFSYFLRETDREYLRHRMADQLIQWDLSVTGVSKSCEFPPDFDGSSIFFKSRLAL